MPIQLSPAQLELQAARRAAKLARAEGKISGASAPAPKLSPEEQERRRFLRREWLNVRTSSGSTSSSVPERKAKIVTWNLLAQTLVRRELFPGSDCLKWGERKPMLLAELEHYTDADVICFQECDRLEDLSKSLPQHSYVDAKGHGKLHGLVILYRSARYRVRASKTIYLDEEYISPPNPEEGKEEDADERRRRRGGTRHTKNIGLMVALEDVDKEKEGILVSTAHLFWHPKFAYERVRQSLILLRCLQSFRKEHDCADWPAVLAGDFNTQCDEATYQLLTDPHQPIPTELQRDVIASRFVHTSLGRVGEALEPSSSTQASAAPSASGTGTSTPAVEEKEKDEEGEGGQAEEEDKDEKSVKGTRPAEPDDGILEMEELIDIARSILPEKGCTSAYSAEKWASDEQHTFGGRKGFERSFGEVVPERLKGKAEPAYTCYTPLFKLTLDYLLILPSPLVQVTGLLRPATAEEMGEGLPRKGICASDHIAVGCEISW